jgi:hypothetical protein
MNKQFNFNSNDACLLLNGISHLIQIWDNPPHGISDNLLIEFKSKAEAFKKSYDMVFDCFKICGLEVMELEAEEV